MLGIKDLSPCLYHSVSYLFHHSRQPVVFLPHIRWIYRQYLTSVDHAADLCQDPSSARLVLATPLTAAAPAIGCAPTGTLTAAAPGNPQRKTYISSSMAGSTSSSIAAVIFCGKSEQDQEGQLSTEHSLYSIALYPPALPPSPCKPPFHSLWLLHFRIICIRNL